MQISKRVIPFAVLVLSACGPGAVSQDVTVSTSESALTTTTVSRGCTFTVAAVQQAGFPPTYNYVLTRQSSTTCPWGAVSTIVGSSYTANVAVTGNDLGVAVAFSVKNTMSGSSPVSVSIKHIAPDTLTPVRTTGLSCGPSYYSVSLGNLTMPDGTTLQVDGSKGCVLYGQSETGSGSSYTAYYFDFFTSTQPPTVFAY
jgi:hypothetical protein